MGRRIIQFFVLLYLITTLLAAPADLEIYYTDAGIIVFTITAEPEDTSYCDYECYGGYGRRRRRCTFCATAATTPTGERKKLIFRKIRLGGPLVRGLTT